MIKQKELQDIKKRREGFEKIREEQKIPRAELMDLEKGVAERIKKGEKIEPGSIQVILKQDERRTPPWRKIVEKLKGTAYVEKIIKKTEPTVTMTLVVQYVYQKAE